MNPNVLSLKENIHTCPIYLGYLVEPEKPNSCTHIFCRFCLQMWLQKKEFCPLCKKYIDGLSNLYFINEGKKKNHKLNHLFNSIKYLKLDYY